MNTNNITYELPPIRKIGPAVLPKPKNIKIQAGRAKSPLDYDSASSCGVFVVDSNNNYNNSNNNNNNSNSNNSSMNLSGDELPPPPSDSVLNEFSSQYKNDVKNNNNNNMSTPNRAKLIQIPVEIVNFRTNLNPQQYQQAQNAFQQQQYQHQLQQKQHQQHQQQIQEQKSPLQQQSQILSTSQYRFPRKSSNSSLSNLPTSNSSPSLKLGTYQTMSSASSLPPPSPPPASEDTSSLSSSSHNNNHHHHHRQHQPPPNFTPSTISLAKTLTLNGLNLVRPNRTVDNSDNNSAIQFVNKQKPPTTINFSADGSTNRPTITITTTRGPNSPTLTATSPTSANSFTYNIPVQHMTNQPFGNGNFIISTSSHEKPTLISNGSYIIPVNMKLSNLNGANATTVTASMIQPNSPNSTMNRSSSSSSSISSSGSTNTNNNNNNNNNNNANSNMNGTQITANYTTNGIGYGANVNGNGSGPNSPKSPTHTNATIGNILIKTSGGNNIITTNRVEDEVDLLKDLLIKNLNSSSNDPNNFFGVCTKCNEQIIGAENGLKAMDNLFHVTCFVCCGCGIQLQGHHFYAMENRSFCENCYMRLLERCSLCQKPITDRILRATGKPFHPECFCCVMCKKNLDGIPFTVDASNKIHCIDCFHDKYAPRCYICHLPITPEPGQEETVRIVAMDKSFHVNCYKCEDCGISLSSNSENAGGCFPLDDHIFCKNCNIKRIRNLVNSQGMFPSQPHTKYQTANLTPRSTDL